MIFQAIRIITRIFLKEMMSMVPRLHTINKIEIFKNISRKELSIRYSHDYYIIHKETKIKDLFLPNIL